MKLDAEQKMFVRSLVAVMREMEALKPDGQIETLVKATRLQTRLHTLSAEADDRWPDEETQGYIATVAVRYLGRLGGKVPDAVR